MLPKVYNIDQIHKNAYCILGLGPGHSALANRTFILRENDLRNKLDR